MVWSQSSGGLAVTDPARSLTGESNTETMTTNCSKEARPIVIETKIKSRAAKSVHFAPDVKPGHETDTTERTVPTKPRLPSASLFNLSHVVVGQADQLPAVVEKYMIRSLPPASSTQQSSGQAELAVSKGNGIIPNTLHRETTTNIIYIDNVGMRYKTPASKSRHNYNNHHNALSRSLDLSAPTTHRHHRHGNVSKDSVQTSSHLHTDNINSHKGFSSLKGNEKNVATKGSGARISADTLLTSSSTTLAQIKGGQQMTNACHGQNLSETNAEASQPPQQDDSVTDPDEEEATTGGTTKESKKSLDRRKYHHHGYGSLSRRSADKPHLPKTTRITRQASGSSKSGST